MERFMTAGACFDEPDEGDLRLVCGTVTHFLPGDARANDCGDVKTPGLLVQEYGPRYSDDGFPLCGGGVWRTLSPLVDFPKIYGVLATSCLPSMRATR